MDCSERFWDTLVEKNLGSRGKETWVWTPASAQSSCISLGKFLLLLWFSHLWRGAKNSSYLRELWAVNEIVRQRPIPGSKAALRCHRYWFREPPVTESRWAKTEPRSLQGVDGIQGGWAKWLPNLLQIQTFDEFLSSKYTIVGKEPEMNLILGKDPWTYMQNDKLHMSKH